MTRKPLLQFQLKWRFGAIAVVAAILSLAIPVIQERRDRARRMEATRQQRLIEERKRPPTVSFSELPDLPEGPIDRDGLLLSVQESLNRRVKFSGYLTPDSPERPEAAQRVLLREHWTIASFGRPRMREYVLVELRRMGAFTPKFDRLMTFEGVFELRDVVSRDGETWSYFALADAVEVRNQ
jgi:hypothetical protein